MEKERKRRVLIEERLEGKYDTKTGEKNQENLTLRIKSNS